MYGHRKAVTQRDAQQHVDVVRHRLSFHEFNPVVPENSVLAVKTRLMTFTPFELTDPPVVPENLIPVRDQMLDGGVE